MTSLPCSKSGTILKGVTVVYTSGTEASLMRSWPLIRRTSASRGGGLNLLTNAPQKALGFLSFTLHAHLPYVVNYGTWPHGMEWLLEAAAETYLPLLRVLGRLEKDGIALHCNLSLSPILMEQLSHPVFREEYPKYVIRKIVSAPHAEAFFTH